MSNFKLRNLSKEKTDTKHIKPILIVVTYRGVKNFDPGFHVGKNKDVLIVGSDYKPTTTTWYNWTSYCKGPKVTKNEVISKKEASSVYNSEAKKEMINFLGNAEIYVYLGKDGASSGFDFIYNLFKEHGLNKNKIILIACDCGWDAKVEFARKTNLQLVECECGGTNDLEKIVKNALA